jgi:protein Mpv17
MFPQATIASAFAKGVIEQISYTPFAMTSFFFGMSLLEGKTKKEALEEVTEKFWPTYQVAICIWPFIQTFNFSVVPERNRVPFISVCSFMWTIFLAYMKQLQFEKKKKTNVE